jgi:predicted nucleotidyltransferase
MNRPKISKLIHDQKPFLKQRFGFDHIYLFGSFACGNPTAESDVDLLIDAPKSAKTFRNYLSAKSYLENLFKRKVDLVYK